MNSFITMKNFTCLICLLLLAYYSNGQLKKEHYLFRLGIRQVSIGGDKIYEGKANIKPVIDVGFGINYPLSKQVNFQPTINYTPRGYKSSFNYTDSTNISQELSLHYLDFCPNFSVRFSKKDYGNTVFIWGGPYVGVGLWGNTTVEGKLINPKNKLADSTYSITTNSFNNGVKRIDYGINVGIGIQSYRFIRMGISYSLGFNNLSDDRKVNYYHQSFGIFANVLFDDMF